jgi:signal transduction histidine kinase
MLSSMMSFALVLIVYIPAYGASVFLNIGEELSIFEIISQSFGALVWITVHFFTVRFALEFYRQYFKLSETLKELDESKKQLQKAYDELEMITALTERQRIAKEIHDTAGHSITTVIMQTEAAKLVIDTDAEAAKKNIVAANLQAKHALEERRESVHVLSGVSEREPLKSALQRIIGETVDGTGIRIRSEIDDVTVDDEKYRFVCNTFKEGLSNGIRHGKATAFWMELKKGDSELTFLLSDNGNGVPVDALNKGFGLSGMEREAARLGGDVTFVSERDEGFEIHLRLPLDCVSATKNKGNSNGLQNSGNSKNA